MQDRCVKCNGELNTAMTCLSCGFWNQPFNIGTQTTSANTASTKLPCIHCEQVESSNRWFNNEWSYCPYCGRQLRT